VTEPVARVVSYCSLFPEAVRCVIGRGDIKRVGGAAHHRERPIRATRATSSSVLRGASAMPRTDALDLFLVGRSLIRETEQLRRLALAMI
jgi:hypothetical protein